MASKRKFFFPRAKTLFCLLFTLRCPLSRFRQISDMHPTKRLSVTNSFESSFLRFPLALRRLFKCVENCCKFLEHIFLYAHLRNNVQKFKEKDSFYKAENCIDFFYCFARVLD